MDQIAQISPHQTIPRSTKGFDEPYSKIGILSFSLDEEGLILDANVIAYEFLGFENDDLIGISFVELFQLKFQMAIQSAVDKCFHRGYIKDVEYPIVNKQKQVCHFQFNGFTEKWEGDSQPRIRILAKDITDLVQLKRRHDLLSTFPNLIANHEDQQIVAENLIEEIQTHYHCSGVGFSLIPSKIGQSFSCQWVEGEGGAGMNVGASMDAGIWPLVIQSMQHNGGNSSEKDSYWTGDWHSIVQKIPQMPSRLETLADYKSILMIPFKNESDNQGYFFMLDIHRDAWTKEDVVCLETVIHQMGASESKPSSSFAPKGGTLLSVFDVPDIGFIFTEKDTIVHVNRWMREYLNLAWDALVGCRFSQYIYSEHQHLYFSSLKRHSESKSPEKISDILLSLIDGYGSQKKTICSMTSFMMDDSYVTAWICVPEKSIFTKSHHSDPAQQLESLSLIVNGIVHELNNTLACIQGLSSVAVDEVDPSSQISSDLGQINVASEDAAQLIQRLTAHTMDNPLILANVDLNLIVKEVAGALSKSNDSEISIQADLDQNINSLRIDATAVHRIILWIGMSAYAKLYGKGKIHFKTREIILRRNAALTEYGANPGKYIQITIQYSNSESHQMTNPDFNQSVRIKPISNTAIPDLNHIKAQTKKLNGFLTIIHNNSSGAVFKIHFPSAR